MSREGRRPARVEKQVGTETNPRQVLLRSQTRLRVSIKSLSMTPVRGGTAKPTYSQNGLASRVDLWRRWTYSRGAKKTMKLVRSDSPEMLSCIASASARASRHWPALAYGRYPNVLILLIAVTMSLSFSVRAATWLGVPVLLAWNVYVLWCTKSSSRNWVIAGCGDRIFIRLFMTLGSARHGANEPDVIVLEASEIASMSIETVEVFLYGPKPKLVERLVIEPAQFVAESVSDQIRSSLCAVRADPSNRVHLANEDGRLIIGWKRCHPALRAFLQEILREFPSVVIGREERSELDLNGIWHGISMNFDAQQRQMLVRVNRLGFGRRLAWLLGMYKYISYKPVSPQQAAAYLAELEQEEARVQADPTQESSLSSQTLPLVPAKGPAVSSCSVERPESRILAMALALGWTYVCVRAAVSVIALTYASTDREGLLFLLSGSLVYFGIYESIAIWVRLKRNAPARWLRLIEGAPDSLVLGAIALTVRLFFKHSDMESRAYPLRILLVVVALSAVLSLSRGFPKLLRATRGSGAGGRQLHSEAENDAIGIKHGSADWWSSISAFQRSLLVVSYIFNSTLWTWLVIYYRYYARSFLGQSSWVMAFLWIFVAFCWANCAGFVFGALQSAKDGSIGPPADSPTRQPR